MITNLDLLIIVVMVLAAVGILALSLMFLVRNKKLQKVSFYAVAILGLYAGYAGFRIFFPMFMGKLVITVLLAAAAIAAIVLERLSKDNEKLFRIAKILAAASLVLGMINSVS